ncbi:MAG TPA: YncE family protein [Baekduia sp.]|nr:YncE family protein [Baekduia sp.]
MIRIRTAALAILATLAPAASASAASSGPDAQPGVTRPAILIGNNWDGTTDIVDPETFRRLDRVNVIPDRAEREAEIAFSPDRLGFYLAIRELIGEGNHQYNDDVFSSNDGTRIFVSRPSFADVVAIDLATKKIAWRAPVDGYRADHMAISADGKRLLVSASTGNVVHELDTETGKRIGGFPSGDSPHENVYSKDGSTIFHASIGRVYLPTDRPQAVSNAAKGGQFFQVVDARTGEVRKRIDMAKKMEEAGHEGFSGAVRPMAISPDEKLVYFQLSFFHGFVEYDLVNDKVLRIARLPIPEETQRIPPEQYLLDSAHHGLALDPTARKLCVAGTMSDYAAIVDRQTFAPTIIPGVKKPYWSTNSADGRHCYVSASMADEVQVINYESAEVVHRIPVGRHPQRVRNGVVRVALYPQGKHGEAFRLQTQRARSVRMAGGDAAVPCRAAGAQELRLVRCAVELRTPARRGARPVVLAAGERMVQGATAFRVDVDLTRAGRALLRRRGSIGARLVARGVDSVGRTATVTRRVVVRR